MREDILDLTIRSIGVWEVLSAAWHFIPDGCRRLNLPYRYEPLTHQQHIDTIATVRREYHENIEILPLREQVCDYEDTQSAFSVVKDHFFRGNS